MRGREGAVTCDSNGAQNGRDSFLLWSPTVVSDVGESTAVTAYGGIPAIHRPRSYHPAKHFADVIPAKSGSV